MAFPNGLNFDNVYPYNALEVVERDGQKMMKFPKIFVKGGLLPEGAEFAGKRFWSISEFPREGYHVHPAFMHKGEALDYVLIGQYEASSDGTGKPQSLAGKTPWVNITTPNAIAACLKRNTGDAGSEQYGWHIENVYEYQLISLLMLIEIGSPDVQKYIGNGNINGKNVVATGSTNAVWRDFHEHWANAWEIVDGLKTGASGQVLIWDKDGNETYQDTGVIVQDKGFARKKEEGYDLGDLFIPADDGSNTTFTNSTADYVWTGQNTVCYLGGGWNGGAQSGAFAFYVNYPASYSCADIGFRLAKYDI